MATAFSCARGCKPKRPALPLLLATLVLPLGCAGNEGPTDPTSRPLQVRTTALHDAVRDFSWTEELAAEGGDGQYTWAIMSGSLPTGLRLDSETGEISGVPRLVETQDFMAQVESLDGQIASRELRISVYDHLAVTTTSLPEGFTGTTYDEALAVSGGRDGYRWYLTDGALPAGLTLATHGSIRGTPAQVGTRDFTVEAVSQDGQVATRSLTISVGPYCKGQPASATAPIEDGNLAAAIRGALGLGSQDEIACDQASALRSLEASGAGIESLAGIENLTSSAVSRVWSASTCTATPSTM